MTHLKVSPCKVRALIDKAQTEAFEKAKCNPGEYISAIVEGEIVSIYYVEPRYNVIPFRKRNAV